MHQAPSSPGAQRAGEDREHRYAFLSAEPLASSAPKPSGAQPLQQIAMLTAAQMLGGACH